ncbi:hypothetical protein [Roseomonas sp. CECT 9278]|uniref:hypothetical protein n=1 Tax=Roseomonas sp. CECT 9278 TaxID=2845823 RepID=UPI001E48632C|nr:hypothetical protein [Roseomonas sp. CECT 9278]CAH0266486.1 hypothetical protein ROS9278_03538 [Roseomonas sp. CECT 9278]
MLLVKRCARSLCNSLTKARDMPKPPFTKNQMFNELKLVVRAMANHIAAYGSAEAAEVLAGFRSDNAAYPYAEDDPNCFDLARFRVTAYMDIAYDYAFQTGNPERFGDDRAQDINEFRQSAVQQSSTGDRSPMGIPDSKCRIVTDLAFARWQLEQEFDLTVRELALLAGMTEPAVRNSLSNENIKMETARRPGEPGKLDGAVAYAWLRKRRGFIDSRDPSTRRLNRVGEFRAMLREQGLSRAFTAALNDSDCSADLLAERASVAPAFLEALAAGKPPLDLKAAQRVGSAMGFDVPSFVGAVVEAALRN